MCLSLADGSAMTLYGEYKENHSLSGQNSRKSQTKKRLFGSLGLFWLTAIMGFKATASEMEAGRRQNRAGREMATCREVVRPLNWNDLCLPNIVFPQYLLIPAIMY